MQENICNPCLIKHPVNWIGIDPNHPISFNDIGFSQIFSEANGNATPVSRLWQRTSDPSGQQRSE